VTAEFRPALERFLAAARQPVLIEPGEDPIPIGPHNFLCSGPAARPSIECWSASRTLFRRIAAVRAERPGQLELATERFGGRRGQLLLVDLARPANAHALRRGARLKFREQFRLALRRQYPDWRIAEISTEPDLEHSLSPAYPRAMLRQGPRALAAIGAAEDSPDPDGALTFGLIWLDYLRRREPRLSVGGLLVFLPAGSEVNTCHRVRCLDHQLAQVAVFVHGAGGIEQAVRPEDYTNFSTYLRPPRTIAPRSDTPEALLETQVRANLQRIDGTLLAEPVYRQAPQLASAHRGVLDLLAVDFEGRLTVLELKASEDIHLPLQALDYWMRVNWHRARGDFDRAGYFPGIALRPQPPRLLLVAPAVQFHPANETILRLFSRDVAVERVGLGLEWRRELQVVLRAPCHRSSFAS
jgi:hypothetical protein